MNRRALGLFVIFVVCGFGMVPAKSLAQLAPISFPFTGTDFPNFFAEPRPVLGSEGLRFGPVQVRPTLGVATIFTDNVFRDNKPREADIGYAIAPGIQAFLPIGELHSFMIDYRGSQHWYQRFSENNIFSQEASGYLSFKYPGGVTVSLLGQHVGGYDPRGSILDLQLPEMTQWNTNTFVGKVRYFGPRFGFGLSMTSRKYNATNNDQGRFRDHLTNSANFSFHIKATRKIYGTLSFGIQDITYDENKQLDGFMYSINAGFTIPLGEQLTGQFLAGISVLNFDRAALPLDQAPPDGLSPGGETQKRQTMMGDIAWKPSSRIMVNLRTFRRIQQAAVFGANVFFTTGISLNASYRLTDRTTLFGGTRFSNNEFTSELSGRGDRVDDLFFQSVGVTYRAVRWLGVKLMYSYAQRSSTAPEGFGDYYANSFLISLQGIL